MGDTAEVTIRGAGAAEVNVKTQIVASISGAGAVEYHGTPKVIKTITGVGVVKQIK